MKHQVLFSLKKIMKKYSRLSSAAVMTGTLRVKMINWYTDRRSTSANSFFAALNPYRPKQN